MTRNDQKISFTALALIVVILNGNPKLYADSAQQLMRIAGLLSELRSEHMQWNEKIEDGAGVL